MGFNIILDVETWWTPFKSYLVTEKNITWDLLTTTEQFHTVLR